MATKAGPLCSGCTKGAVKQAAAAVKKGCEKDLDDKHYMAVVSLALLDNYEITRKVACTTQKNADQYCISQIMKDFQKASGKIFIPSYFSAVAAQPIAFINSLKGVSTSDNKQNSWLTGIHRRNGAVHV